MTAAAAGTVLIDGTWSTRDERVAVHDPADGSLVGAIDWGSPTDAVRAADAAAAAFASWADTPARTRADVLHEAAALLRERSAELGALLAREAGKRLPEAVGEVQLSAEYFRWFAEQVRRPTGDVAPPETPGRRHLTVRRPTGVVASLTPWNFPCSLQARKLAPALAAGCTVVARVSEKAPLAVTEMIRCLTDAGVPAGVLNLVHGPARETTQALLDHRAVRVVSFTGSTPVGREIMARAAGRVVRPLLELGGNAPFLVFADADVEAAVEGAVLAKFRNTGQSCIAANRFLVHDAVYDQFVSSFVARVDAMTIGHGSTSPCPDLAPVIDDDRAKAVSALVDEARSRGAELLTAERAVPDGGSYVAPALLAGVPDDVGLATEEVFGPVSAVFRFSDDDEAYARANDTEMGLAGYVWTRDVGRCFAAGDRLEAGIVGINQALPTVVFSPMGGVKQSGLGREGADLGLEEFFDVRYLSFGP